MPEPALGAASGSLGKNVQSLNLALLWLPALLCPKGVWNGSAVSTCGEIKSPQADSLCAPVQRNDRTQMASVPPQQVPYREGDRGLSSKLERGLL